eukprot:TRINITY_DN114170_c0_g1_i1.p1 TRINITY_DN114170_c0_g1~~TRINITY_DN114170_c0_g1_i1.p1  ORF type:complete len:291 (-),score=57.10 TRINITY_DN114170_c0_g1_i1:9-881(-)
MVFVERIQDHAWLKQMTWRPAQKKDISLEGSMFVAAGWDVPEELRHWRGFEFADILEEGKGPGLTSNYVEPSLKQAEDERLVVRVEGDTKKFVLTTPDGDELLSASALSDGLGFDIFVVSEAVRPKALGPAFTLRCDKQLEHWALESVRCERCEARGSRHCGTRELARMFHYWETVGEGNAFCMDVELPELKDDGSSNVVCTVCGDDNVGGSVLSTRRPKWNQRHKTMTLDFRGRCPLASASNFQLEAEDKSKVSLLFGKVALNKFALDYCHPLGMVQAFAAALTATHWK